MSIKQHHLLRILAFLIFTIAAVVALCTLTSDDDTILLGYGVAFIIFFLGMLAPHMVKKYIPAACPKCAGPAYGITSDEGKLSFKCSKCGHVHQTKWEDGPSSDVT